MGGPAFEEFPSLTMTRVDTIADGKAWLEDLKDFAVARGWTNESYQTGVSWLDTGGGVYGWSAGSGSGYGDFLQISSDGYNSVQKLRYRFFAESGTGEHKVTWNMIDPAYNVPSSASASKPYNTTNQGCVSIYTYYGVLSFPDSSFPGCWFIGNDRFLAWEAEVVTAAALMSGACGTFELLLEYQNLADELSCRWPGFYRQSNTKWDDYLASPAWFGAPMTRYLGDVGNTDYLIYWDSQGAAGGGTYNTRFTYATSCGKMSGDTAQAWGTSGEFGRDRYVIENSGNVYSNKRVLVKPKVYLRHSDGKWMPGGTLPVYNTYTAGLAMGEQITYGGQTFVCFPNGIGSYNYGHCYDIT